MLTKSLASTLRYASYFGARSAILQSKVILTRPMPVLQVPKRTSVQVGLVISTPARIPVSNVEKLIHIAVMYVLWIAPVMWFLTQIKVWRRKYVS